MHIWMRFGIGVAALALAVGIGAGAQAIYGNDDAPPPHAAVAPEAGGDDASAAAGSGLAMSCLAGATDCNDNPGIKYEDPGPAPVRCDAEATECLEPAACPPEECTSMPAESCKTTTAEDGSTVETCVGCGWAEPSPGPRVDPLAPVDPPVDLPLGAPEPDPAVSGPSTDFQIAPDVAPPPPGGPATDFQIAAPDFDPGVAGTGCLGADPCSVSSTQLCLPGNCFVSPDGVIGCGFIPACQIEPLPPGETAVKPVPSYVPCAVSPCLGNDPLAGIPQSCESSPCTIFTPDQPKGVPCNSVDRCAVADPSVGSPERGTRTCPPIPGASGGGTSGSGGSITGAATPTAP